MLQYDLSPTFEYDFSNVKFPIDGAQKSHLVLVDF